MEQVKRTDEKTKSVAKAISVAILVFFGNIQAASAVSDPWADNE